mmetsp:Transcript_30568/g.98508  ORF Transcript_30568/g.98508 Transcript_30568/m.98508 type:complete len:107 (-) Transcript_30568:381-701(-)
MAKGEAATSKRPKAQELVTRDYTINLHKRLHGITFKKKAPRAIREIKVRYSFFFFHNNNKTFFLAVEIRDADDEDVGRASGRPREQAHLEERRAERALPRAPAAVA